MKAVLCGAGKIGRGIIAKSIRNAGHSLVILDVNPDIIQRLSSAGFYQVRSLDQQVDYTERVSGYEAYLLDSDAAKQAFLEADIIFISVGLNQVESFLRAVLPYMLLRIQSYKPALDMVFCENCVGIRAIVEAILADCFEINPELFAGRIGFAGGSVGVVVPPSDDPLFLIKGPYEDIHIEEAALITPVRIPHFIPTMQFELNIREKLYIYNMAHAMSSYLGWLRGIEFVDQAYRDPSIYPDVRSAMELSAQALALEYQVSLEQEIRVVNDIERRICNDKIRDTVVRIAADPIRKLGSNDRLCGTLQLLRRHGLTCDPLLKGIAAAFRFNEPADESAVRLQARINELGIRTAIRTVTGQEDEEVVKRITDHYDRFIQTSPDKSVY